MNSETITRIRKLNQANAYTSIQMHEAVARRAGLSGTDHKYLGFLMQKAQMTAGELAAITGLTTGAVTGLIDRFEKRKLVRRRFDSSDRRKVFIVPETENIMALLGPLYSSFRSRYEQLVGSLSDAEAQVIEAYLQKSTAIMNETITELNVK